MPLEGRSVYEPEVMEMMKRLQASSVVMIVVDGNRNEQPIQYASAIRGAEEVYNVIKALEQVVASMKADLLQILTDQKYKRGPIHD